MGYVTRYQISTIEGPDRIEDVLDSLGESNFEDLFYAVDESGETNEPSKWYEHERDLILISKNYPKSVFKLYGRGSEPEDIWNKYFKDGKMQHEKARMTIPEYNPELLK